MGNIFMHTGKTFTAEEQKDRVAKALKLNEFDFIPATFYSNHVISDINTSRD